MGKVNFFPLKYWKNIRIHNFGSDHFYPISTFLLIFFRHISGVEPYFHIFSVYVFCFLSIFTHLPLWPSAVCPLHHGACPAAFTLSNLPRKSVKVINEL